MGAEAPIDVEDIMAYSTFCQTNNDQLKEPMFFGQSVNVARYDQQKFEIFEKLIEKQLSSFGVRKKWTYRVIALITTTCPITKGIFSSAT